MKQKIGIVINNRMKKTILVKTKYRYLHPIFSKIIIKTKKYMVHENQNICKIGDKIIFQQCRPISKTKCWKFLSLIKKSTF